MKRVIIAFLVVAFPMLSMAAVSVSIDKVDVDTTDVESLQRGAKLYTGYCAGCHSARFVRYSSMARDLQIDEKRLVDEFIVGVDKPGEMILTAMTKPNAEKWFGTKIPDLSLVARSRGEDWLYSYLRAFYVDPSKPFGVNNTVFKSVAMPNVLWELQGVQEAVFAPGEDGKPSEVVESLKLVQPGSMSPEEYDAAIRDLVNFLSYIGEPTQNKRRQLGVWVIGFLLVLFVFAYFLKKEYWRDIH